ncbi:hypothetical protein [uncultured Dokdonia sp.]|uniref:hypothetical protein n=1 Tax=uncultured Dokdonia sp. TaxID=575653 RepID=UPI0026145D62|nr:hypothetical protein [uncultured Dokdonia sp.]
MNTLSLHYFSNKKGSLDIPSSLQLVEKIYQDTRTYDYEVIRVGKKCETVPHNERFFYEIFIDQQPLSSLLDVHYENTTPLLFNWIGLLKSNSDTAFHTLLIKSLLKLPIADEEFLVLFEKGEKEVEDIPFTSVYDLKQNFIKLYTCPYCDHVEPLDCGGYHVKVFKKEHSYVWQFDNKGKNILSDPAFRNTLEKTPLTFEFDKNIYEKVFFKFLKEQFNVSKESLIPLLDEENN